MSRSVGSDKFAVMTPGLTDLMQSFLALKGKLKPVFRQAAKKSATPMMQDVRSRLPARGKRILMDGKKQLIYGQTGQLKKSIAVKVNTSKKTGIVTALIGAKRGKFGSKKIFANKRGQMVEVRPSRYLHLIESGFMWMKKRRIPGKHYLANAMARNQSGTIRITRELIDIAIQKAVAKQAGPA